MCTCVCACACVCLSAVNCAVYFTSESTPYHVKLWSCLYKGGPDGGYGGIHTADGEHNKRIQDVHILYSSACTVHSTVIHVGLLSRKISRVLLQGTSCWN